MRTVSVFYDQTLYTFTWLSALLWADREFHKKNIKIKFEYKCKYGLIFDYNFEKLLKKSKKKYDIVILAFHHNHDFYKDNYLDIVRNFYSNSKRVVWLDTADSCGTCKFEVLPYVHKYLKKQLYVDFNLYKKDIWGGRLYCEYYHEKLGYEDDEISKTVSSKLKEQYEDKIGLSWNVGLGNLFETSRVKIFLNPKRRNQKFNFDLNDFNERQYKTHFRGSPWSIIAGYQRQLTRKKMAESGYIVPDYNSRCSHKQYINEVKKSQSITSPFGWGEICTRDFEAFLYGCILLKPDMSHLKTYPDFYNESRYVSIDWDFENYLELLKNLDSYKKIAINGHKFYLYQLSRKGRQDFVDHLIKEMDV